MVEKIIKFKNNLHINKCFCQDSQGFHSVPAEGTYLVRARILTGATII